jgi:hypothetical protein
MTLDLEKLTRDQSRAKWTLGDGDDALSYDGEARAVVVKYVNRHDVPESFTGPWVRIDVLDMVIAAELPDDVLRARDARPNAIWTLRLPELAGIGVYRDMQYKGTRARVEVVEIQGTLSARDEASQTYTLTPASGTPRWLKAMSA